MIDNVSRSTATPSPAPSAQDAGAARPATALVQPHSPATASIELEALAPRRRSGEAPADSAPSGTRAAASKLRKVALQIGSDRAQAARQVQRNITLLQDNVREFMQARRAERNAYMSRVEALVNAGEHRAPVALRAQVLRGPDGALHSPNRAIAALLRYVQACAPEAARNLRLPAEGIELALPLEPDILLKTRAFVEGCKARQIPLTDGGAAEEDVDLSTHSAREAIKNGTHAFGSDAALRVAHGHEHGPHPFAFLADVRYTAQCEHAELRELVTGVMNDPRPATLELRGRLGAQAIRAITSQKHFSPELGYAMAASLVASGGLAYALDVWAWGSAAGAIAKQYGAEHALTRFASVMLDSLTPLFAETADSLIIKRLLGVFKGEPLLPSSFSEFIDDLKDSAISGGIAALGSVPNNAIGLSKHAALIPLNVVTNQLAVSTSAAMVPRELERSHDAMAAGVIAQTRRGFLAGEAPLTGEAADARALAARAKRDTQGSLGVAPGDGLAINSMGIGSVISLLSFAGTTALTRTGKIPESVQKIVTIMVNTPTEILSLGAGILTANHLRGAGMTSDDEKNQRMVELIANKAVERLNLQSQGGDASVQITESELKAIEHPALALTFPSGKSIVEAMNGVVGLLSATWGALRGNREPGFAEKVGVDAQAPRRQSQMPGTFPMTV